MATSREHVIQLFEDFFSRHMNQPFDEDTKVSDVDGFDSLAMVDLSIEFEDAFGKNLNLEAFKDACYLREVVDEAMRLLQ